MNVADLTDDTMTDVDELRVDLAAHRQAHGLSLRTVARRVGCALVTLHRFETGTGILTAAQRSAIRELVR